MGSIVPFSRHARASSAKAAAGLTTCSGHSKSSGHLSENQAITSSYLRAVNVLASSSSRSKKRQSPAAKRPMVDMLTERDAAYAEAQAMRFERSSVSMVSEDSRKIPTLQAGFVGNFPLAQSREKSDKSAMTTAAQIRGTIREALAAKGLGEIEVVSAMKGQGLTTVHRTYLTDFLKGKKQSLSFDFSKELADFLQIDADLLRVKRAPTATVIHRGARPHLYISEHMDERSWDDADVAARIDGIGGAETVRAWRARPEKLVDWQIQALIHAFGMEEIGQLARPPITVKKVPAARKKARRRV